MGTLPGSTIPLSIDMTSLSAAQANILLSTMSYVKWQNDEWIKEYGTAYSNYVIRMQSGGVVSPDDQKVPMPHMAYIVGPPDANGGFQFPLLSDKPVCPPGPALMYSGGLPSGAVGIVQSEGLTEDKVDIGPHIVGNYYASGQQDTWPDGKETGILPDGHNYTKEATIGSVTITWPDGKVGSHNGWYLRTS